VEAKFKGGSKWFKARVVEVNRDGSYSLRYDDGDEDAKVPPENVRSVDGSGGETKTNEPSSSAAAASETLRMGDKVEAKFKGGAKWFGARVLSVNRDGTYSLRYDDGDEDSRVPASDVRSVGGSGGKLSKASSESFVRGDRVEAKFKGGSKWFKARVVEVNRDGSYSLRYDDGDEDAKVPPENVRYSFEASSEEKSGNGDSFRKGISGVLIPLSLYDKFSSSVSSFFERTDTALGAVIESFIDSESGNKDSFQRRPFQRFIDRVCRDIDESDSDLLFEVLNSAADGSLPLPDFILFVSSACNSEKHLAKALKASKAISGKKKVQYSELVSLFSKFDAQRSGLVDFSAFEKVYKKLFGTFTLSLTDLNEIASVADSQRRNQIDYRLVCSIAAVCNDANRAEERLRHALKIARIRNVDYRSKILDSTKEVASEDDIVASLAALGLGISQYELSLVIQKYSKRGEVPVKIFLEKLENDPAAGKASRGRGDDAIGEAMINKILKLRSDEDKRESFRSSLLSRDPDLVGLIQKRDLQRCLDQRTNFLESESLLLSENLIFTDGSHKQAIDYSLFLLVLLEPISSEDVARAASSAGNKVMKKMMRGSDSVSLRRLLSLLFRNFAASDSRGSGLVTPDVAESVMSVECSNVEPQDLKLITRVFQDKSTDLVRYPELIGFLGCCSLWNVIYRIHLLNMIRIRQGYNLSLALTQKVGKKKVITRPVFKSVMIAMGVLVPEAALDTIFSHYGENGEMEIDVFMKGLNSADKDSDSNDDKPKTRPRVDIAQFKDAEFRDPVAGDILKIYDENLVSAVQRSFDLFDLDGSDSVEIVELERILCALGHTPSSQDLQLLVDKIDPRNTGMMMYEVFMEKVLAYLREKYESVHLLSRDKLRSAFERLDVSGDGYVTKEECMYVLNVQVKTLTSEEVDALFNYLDVDKSGALDIMEFAAIFDLIMDAETLMALPYNLQRAIRKVSESSLLSCIFSLFFLINCQFSSTQLQYTALPNPEKLLYMFAGLPSNYRTSTLAELSRSQLNHGLGTVVCPKKLIEVLTYNIFIIATP
jgi:Ca2+-binding EF-hand superfamily protein